MACSPFHRRTECSAGGAGNEKQRCVPSSVRLCSEQKEAVPEARRGQPRRSCLPVICWQPHSARTGFRATLTLCRITSVSRCTAQRSRVGKRRKFQDLNSSTAYAHEIIKSLKFRQLPYSDSLNCPAIHRNTTRSRKATLLKGNSCTLKELQLSSSLFCTGASVTSAILTSLPNFNKTGQLA